MVEQGVNVNKDVRHVVLKMTSKEVEQYSTTGWDLGDRVLKQPLGIDIIWYPRGNPSDDMVSATFFTSAINPDPLSRKTGEDIDKELSYLPVVSDNTNPPGKVSHPYLKVETIFQNPQFEYNKGELDFLRSKPVKGRTEWKSKSQIDIINEQFRREQGIIGEKEKLLVADENAAEKNPFTGEKFYPFRIVQVTSGGDKEHHGAQDTTKDGGTDTALAVPPHEQEITNGLFQTKRMYDAKRREFQEPVRLDAKVHKETLRL